MDGEAQWMSGPGVPEGTVGVLIIGGDDSGELRHLDFSDPPGDMTAEEYEDALRGAAHKAPSEELFVEAVVRSVGADLVLCHGADPAEVSVRLIAFAERIWAEEHPVQ